MALVLGVDSSTQSTKVEARHLDSGELIAAGSARHPPTSPPSSEQDPEAWWQALVAAIAQLGDHRRDVVAMAVAGQQHGLVMLDADARPVRPAKLWNDTTSAPQALRLVEQLGASEWAARTGSVPVASFTISKLAWVAEHEPDSLHRAARVMLPHDYLTFRVCGAHVSDRGDASGTGWFDPVEGNYALDLLALAVPEGWAGELPEVLQPMAIAGVVSDEIATELGLPVGVQVGAGTGDNMAAALGLGLSAGDVAISLGTSGTVFAVSPTPTHDASGAVAGFASATGDYLPLVCTLNATKVTDTVARWLGTDAPGLGQLALAAAARPGDVTLVPYFDGERTPNLPDAMGSLIGLTNETTREQIALAAHDGVLCGLLDGLDRLRAMGATAGGRLFLVGGGSRSAAYRQRTADLCGVEVVVPDTDETVATGAAVQAAAIACGDGLLDVAGRWRLGKGVTVAPVHHAGEVRIRYSRAHDLYSHAR
jgi:xylulokinase